MSLLSVTVKTARFVGPQAHQWNSYVTLKLQHVKSTTAQVKGANPSWGQDFLFEINNLDAGLLIEVWASGRMWDNSVGYHWLHLKDIQHANWVIHGTGKWLALDADLVMRDGQVVGTKNPTGHELLIDARFELPYGTSEVEVDDAVDLQRKLEMYNSMLDEETRAEQARKQHQYYIQCESGVSEDSDYTSDINYPVGQHPNSSASQFLSAANQLTTPQRSLTSSRENSYEKDDDYRTVGSTHDAYQPPPYSTGHRKQLPTVPPHPSNHRTHGQSSARPSHRNTTSGYWEDPGATATEGDPLSYNSRPQSNYRPYSSSSYRGRGDSWGDDGYAKGDQTLRQYSDGYDDAQDYSQSSRTYSKRHKPSSRRGTPSLERQYTMYHGHDDHYGDYYSQEPMDQNGQTKQSSRYRSDSYSSSSYQQQNLYNAQKSSVYDEYSDQFGDYGSAGTICNDYSRTSVDGSSVNNQNYVNDASYGDYGWGGEENSLRDQYNRTNAATAASSKRSGKELPQLPVPQSQSQQVSPYASQSTVKEVSVSSMNVPSIIATQYEDTITASTSASIPPAAVNDRLINSHDYMTDLSTSVADESFYDAVSHTTSAYDNYSTAGVMTSTTSAGYGVSKAVTSVVDSTTGTQQHGLSQQTDEQQYMDTYENQVAYEDWQNYGYYDESGNFILYDQSAYDQTGYYDDQQTITEETVGSAAIVDPITAITTTSAAVTTSALAQHTESMQYSKDQYDPYNTSVTTTAPTTTSAAISGSLQTTEVEVHTHQEDTSYGQYENTEFYDADDGVMMQMDYSGYDAGGNEYAMGYEGEAYDYTGSAYDEPTSIEPSQNSENKKSNIEYNYAYQSAENLSSTAAYDNGYTSTLDRSNSVSRRASFKRQTSTRDYGYGEAMESASVHEQYPNSARNSLTPATVSVGSSLPPATSSATSTAPTASSSLPLPSSGAAAVGAAATAATKLTSEIKSALPQLTSLTKAKTGGLFSSGFSKLGSFVSNAAEKTGVPIPPVIKDAAAAAVAATAPAVNKDIEKTNLETVQNPQSSIPNHVDNMTHGKSSMQPGTFEDRSKDEYYDDQQPYDDGWDGLPSQEDRHRQQQNHPYNDAYDQYEGTEEGPESYTSGPGMRMDSIESNVSEGGRDPESTIEAQYWQKQKERIAKQNSLAAVDSDGFYDSYDPYDKHKGVFQATDSPVPQTSDQSRQFSKEEYEKQHSLDRDEWLNELERQSGRPGHLKRGDTSDMGMSFDRGDSIDQRLPDEYGDEYMDEPLPRSAKGSIDAAVGYAIEPLLKEDMELGDRKSSLEMAPDKEKGSKSVSFEEEPPKAIPERQTKGMPPREKWKWAITRIYAQLAVSPDYSTLYKL